MSVTGHRNENSLTSYIKPSEDERAALSRALCHSTTLHQVHEHTTFADNTRPSAVVDITSPPTLTDSVSHSNIVDMNVLKHEAIMNMFTGSISNSTINVNMYPK